MFNVSTSSDMCIFESPLFNVSGASKIDCSTGATGPATYLLNNETNIPLEFQFTANTSTFTGNNVSFSYEIYKYNQSGNIFLIAPVYASGDIAYSAFTSFSSLTQNIPITSLNLDGEYLIKGYYKYPVCTDFLNRLGKVENTFLYRRGIAYGLYEPTTDYYFIAIGKTVTPILLNNGSNNQAAGRLVQQIILPESFVTFNEDGDEVPLSGVKTFNLDSSFVGDFIVTFNGLTLTKDLDYTFSGTVVTLNEAMMAGDVLSVIYTSAGSNSIKTDNLEITSTITTGTTDNQGDNLAYFNITTNKYEIYTTVTPNNGDSIIVMINGVTLTNGVDFYQSSTNPKRIILQGDLVKGDLLVIVYFPNTGVVNGLTTSSPFISWIVDPPPPNNNGLFTLEVAYDKNFTNMYASATTPYVSGEIGYGVGFTASGTVGTILYYRVKNAKNYTTICGNTISADTYSETVSVTIQSNSINTY
jgi:hypothetical protein